MTPQPNLNGVREYSFRILRHFAGSGLSFGFLSPNCNLIKSTWLLNSCGDFYKESISNEHFTNGGNTQWKPGDVLGMKLDPTIRKLIYNLNGSHIGSEIPIDANEQELKLLTPSVHFLYQDDAIELI